MFASNGILFNHESPIRGETFVTRKIARAVARISKGQQAVLELGNMDARRDWGHAEDYVDGMWRILQHERPEDFVLATGETHTVRKFVELCFEEVGVRIQWRGQGINEVGFDQQGRQLVRVNSKYFRPSEVDLLIGDAKKAREKLGWAARRTIRDLVNEMMVCELEHLNGR
jgi:GDPmannose 4,6-dehydratase